MSTYRYVLQGCNDTNIGLVNEAARAGIPGSKLPVERSTRGYYFISVDSQADHDKVLKAVTNAFAPLGLTVAVVQNWTPSNFSDLS